VFVLSYDENCGQSQSSIEKEGEEEKNENSSITILPSISSSFQKYTFRLNGEMDIKLTLMNS